MKTALRTSLKHSIIRNDMNFPSHWSLLLQNCHHSKQSREVAFWQSGIPQEHGDRSHPASGGQQENCWEKMSVPILDHNWFLTSQQLQNSCIFSLDLLPHSVFSEVSFQLHDWEVDLLALLIALRVQLLRSCLVLALVSPVLASFKDMWACMCRKENKRADGVRKRIN